MGKKRKVYQDDALNSITLHLQARFLERHGVELTRNRRMLLRTQIKNGVAKRLYTYRNGKILYRVFLYDNSQRSNQSYHIVYCPNMDRILTVLPRPDSPEYDDFLKRNGLDREVVESRELTAQEQTALSIRRYLEHNRIVVKEMRDEEIKKRLDAWRGYRYFQEHFCS
jgi:hypothetical protein